jgi:hypothetical protein
MALPYRLWTVLLLTAAGITALHPTREADVFFHLELGRSVLEHHARVVPEPHAFPEFEPECTVPAWLWDVAAYGIYSATGWTGLSIFNLLAALLAAFLIAHWLYAYRDSGGWVAWSSVSAATLICVGVRFELRPQTLALAVLPGYLFALKLHVSRTGAARMKSGALLVALAVVWAQLHGSFVLAPPLVVIMLGMSNLEAWLARTSTLSSRRVDLLVLAGALLALFSGAAGTGVASYIAGHGYGDAVRFIAEMRAPTWSELTALTGPQGKALMMLWLLSLAGLTRRGRWQWTSIALALLGHCVLSRANRFIAEDAILCAPLALSGAANLADWAARVIQPRVLRPLAFALPCAAAALLAQSALAASGPPNRHWVGIDSAAYPQLAAAYLARLPPGSRVLSAFGAGPALGFWSRGKLRTFVDGRTPLYFDDADYALEREVFTNETALDLAIRRYSIQAAVVERAHGVCDLLAKRWNAVVIEGQYTTFVPPERDSALEGIEACGPELVRPKAPSELAPLDRSIVRLAKLGAAPFLDLLRAERLLLSTDVNTAQLTALLDRSASAVYLPQHRRARIAADVAAGRLDSAFLRMRDALAEGDPSVLRFIFAPGMGTLDLSRARELLEMAISLRGEGAKPATRAMLAAICVQQSDAACARFQALRAAARHARNIEPTLAWLTEHAETPRMRADAQAWLDLLAADQAKTASSSPPRGEF